MDLLQYRPQAASLDAVLAAAQASESDDSPAMNEVIRRFEPLAKQLSRSLTEDPYLRDDLANAARMALVRAVRRHDLERAGFPAYAKQFMRGAVIREYRSWITPSVEITLDDELTHTTRGEADVYETESDVLNRLAPWGDGALADAVQGLAADQRLLAERRYVDDEDLSTIAAATGTTVSAVSQRLSTIHRRLELALAA